MDKHDWKMNGRSQYVYNSWKRMADKRSIDEGALRGVPQINSRNEFIENLNRMASLPSSNIKK
jgi:hypothetical protein